MPHEQSADFKCSFNEFFLSVLYSVVLYAVACVKHVTGLHQKKTMHVACGAALTRASFVGNLSK